MDDGKRKIRIAYFIQDLHTGGAERLLLELMGRLDAQRFDVILITLHRRGELFRQLPPGIRKVYCTANPWRLYSILKRERPDVFHSHLWRGDLLGIPLAKLAGVPCICTTRHSSHYFAGLKCVLTPWDAFVQRLAQRRIAVSQAVRREYARRILCRNLDYDVIYNGVDVRRYGETSQPPAASEAVGLLTVANLRRLKGHAVFLEILKRLKDIRWVWRLVGDGPERANIERKAAALGLRERIEFLGLQDDPVKFYQQANLFVLPSLKEGLPLAVLEAMAAGVPVAASGVGGVREIVEDGKTGVLFDIHQPDVAAEKIRRFLNDSTLRETVTAGAKQAAQQFSIDTMARRYMDLYTKSIFD